MSCLEKTAAVFSGTDLQHSKHRKLFGFQGPLIGKNSYPSPSCVYRTVSTSPHLCDNWRLVVQNAVAERATETFNMFIMGFELGFSFAFLPLLRTVEPHRVYKFMIFWVWWVNSGPCTGIAQHYEERPRKKVDTGLTPGWHKLVQREVGTLDASFLTCCFKYRDQPY